MNVGFRLSLYLDSGAILCRLGSIWASFEAHLDVIGPPNGASKRFGDQNGARKFPGMKIVIFGGQQATEYYLQFQCFSDYVPKLCDFLGMLFAGAISLRFSMDSWIPGRLKIMQNRRSVSQNQGFAHSEKKKFQVTI